MPAGRYASNGEPAPAPPPHERADPPRQPPDELADLEAWFTATRRGATGEPMAAAIERLRGRRQ
jgi:hypothetical protein